MNNLTTEQLTEIRRILDAALDQNFAWSRLPPPEEFAPEAKARAFQGFSPVGFITILVWMDSGRPCAYGTFAGTAKGITLIKLPREFAERAAFLALATTI